MTETIYADIDRTVRIWLPFFENQCCMKWEIAQTQSNLGLVSAVQFTWCQFKQKIACEGKSIEDINPDELDRIKALFAQGDTMQLFVFELKEVQAGIDDSIMDCICRTGAWGTSPPIGNEVIFEMGCETKSYRVLPNPDDSPVCNKIDYRISIYDRVWLSSDNVHHLNGLGLLEQNLYNYRCVGSLSTGRYCFVVGWEHLLEHISKIMYDAGWNPSSSTLRTICETVAYLIWKFGNPINLDKGCGLRFSSGLFVSDAIVAQY